MDNSWNLYVSIMLAVIATMLAVDTFGDWNRKRRYKKYLAAKGTQQETNNQYDR